MPDDQRDMNHRRLSALDRVHGELEVTAGRGRIRFRGPITLGYVAVVGIVAIVVIALAYST